MKQEAGSAVTDVLVKGIGASSDCRLSERGWWWHDANPPKGECGTAVIAPEPAMN
jgi:hypothetical protein